VIGGAVPTQEVVLGLATVEMWGAITRSFLDSLNSGFPVAIFGLLAFFFAVSLLLLVWGRRFRRKLGRFTREASKWRSFSSSVRPERIREVGDLLAKRGLSGLKAHWHELERTLVRDPETGDARRIHGAETFFEDEDVVQAARLGPFHYRFLDSAPPLMTGLGLPCAHN
jgi:hypothetical protein